MLRVRIRHTEDQRGRIQPVAARERQGAMSYCAAVLPRLMGAPVEVACAVPQFDRLLFSVRSEISPHRSCCRTTPAMARRS